MGAILSTLFAVNLIVIILLARRRPRAAALLACAEIGLFVYGFWIEPRSLRIERVALVADGLSRPLRIVAIGDPQPIAAHWPPERLRAAFARAAAEKPDLVLWLGDYAYEPHPFRRIGLEEAMFVEPSETIAAMAELTAPLGAYAVLGNHDWWWNGPEVARLIRATPIRLLIDEAAPAAPGLWVVGLDDISAPRRVDLEKAFAAAPTDAVTLVLSHSPDAFPMVKAYANRTGRRRVIMLAGHTHGGQVYAPGLGRPFVPIKHRRYARGLFEEDGARLFVTSGIGTAIMPVRFGTPPEIVVIDLAPRGERP